MTSLEDALRSMARRHGIAVEDTDTATVEIVGDMWQSESGTSWDDRELEVKVYSDHYWHTKFEKRYRSMPDLWKDLFND